MGFRTTHVLREVPKFRGSEAHRFASWRRSREAFPPSANSAGKDAKLCVAVILKSVNYSCLLLYKIL